MVEIGKIDLHFVNNVTVTVVFCSLLMKFGMAVVSALARDYG